MAFNDFCVNGPAILQWGTSGALNRLGITEDGVTVAPEYLRDNIQSDYYGLIPADIQNHGVIARINFTLIQWDESVLDTVRGGITGRAAGAVNAADIGALFMAGNLFGELYAESSVRTGGVLPRPWRFQRCIVMETMPITLGTRASRVQCSFAAFPHNGYCWVRS